jgi:hypothetical protein
VRARRWWSVAGAAVVLTPMAAWGISALASSPGCHPSYTGACLKRDADDYDCADVGRAIKVVGRDEYGLDADHDGIACE